MSESSRAGGGHDGSDGRLVVTFRADPLRVRRLLQRLRSRLAPLAGAGTDLHAVELVLAEVINNVAEHAYSGVPGGPVRLEIEVIAAGLQVRVTDRGAAFAGGTLPVLAPFRAPASPADAPEGGFGWQLIHRFGRDIAYCRDDGANVLTFTVPLP